MHEVVTVEIDICDFETLDDLERYFDCVDQGDACAVLVTGAKERIYGWLLLNCYEDVTPEVYPELF